MTRGRYVRKYLVRGRERAGYTMRRQDMVKDIVASLMVSMDLDKDGIVSMDDFLAWSGSNLLETVVDDQYEERMARASREGDGESMEASG